MNQVGEEKYVCNNTSCMKTFDTPKTITYQVCPFCSTKLEEKEQNKDGCYHYFGNISEHKAGKPIPIECMLNTASSKYAVKEIQKWYQV